MNTVTVLPALCDKEFSLFSTQRPTSGFDCAQQVEAAMPLHPDHRAWIGTVLLHGVHDLRSGERERLVMPWGHHIWLVGPDGAVLDPSIRGLEELIDRSDLELPCATEDLRAEVVSGTEEQARLTVHHLLRIPRPVEVPTIIYMPGWIFSSATEGDDSSDPDQYVHAWGALATDCSAAGGWDARQLEAGFARLPMLALESPTVSKVAWGPGMRPPARGFGTPAQPTRRAARAQRRGRS